MGISEKSVWYKDYIRTTDDDKFILKHFIKDFLFQHRLRYMVYFRKYGIEIKTQTKIGEGFVMCHPYNITVTPFAEIGKNVNIMKGATIGLSGGKRQGAPKIGDCVYIGINSTVLGGITIGNDVLIAPNTFVNCDVPDHSIVIGSPCSIIHRENATAEYIYYRV